MKHCVDFHPKLCYESINKKECQREQCRYIHLPRTQRMVIEAGKCKSCDKTPSNGADTRKHMENHMNHDTTPVPSVDNLEHYPHLQKSQAPDAQQHTRFSSFQGGIGVQEVPGRESSGRLTEVLNYLAEAVKDLQRDNRRREDQERQVWNQQHQRQFLSPLQGQVELQHRL